jgi:hypothetical protein
MLVVVEVEELLMGLLELVVAVLVDKLEATAQQIQAVVLEVAKFLAALVVQE